MDRKGGGNQYGANYYTNAQQYGTSQTPPNSSQQQRMHNSGAYNAYYPPQPGYYPGPMQYPGPTPRPPRGPPPFQQTAPPPQTQYTHQIPQYQNEYYAYSHLNASSMVPPPLPPYTESTHIQRSNTTRENDAKPHATTSSSDTAIKSKSTPPVLEEKKASTPAIMVGKRRGRGRALPTGVVKKAKTDEPESAKDSWSQYMNEVRKYKDQSCEDERKNRPLVK